MLQEHLMVLAQINAAFNEHGWPALLPFMDPDFEFHEPPEQPGAAVLRGHDAALAGWAQWDEAWVEQQSDMQGARELPDGRILAFHRQRLRARNGLRVEQDAASIYTFRDGKVLRWQVFWDRANALEILGLTE